MEDIVVKKMTLHWHIDEWSDLRMDGPIFGCIHIAIVRNIELYGFEVDLSRGTKASAQK